MAETGSYSAGTIFLQVVPVFRDVQNKIRRQAKDIGDTLGAELEKSGKQAGDRAGKAIGQGIEDEVGKSSQRATTELEKSLRKTVKDVNDNLAPIDLRFENNEARKRIKQLKKDFAGFQKDLEKDISPKGLEKMAAKMQIILAETGDLDEKLSDVSKHDFKNISSSLTRLQRKLEGVQRAAEIEVRVETQQAERQMGAFERRIKASATKAARALGDSMNPRIAKLRHDLENLAVADIDAKQAEAKLRELTLRARELSKESVNIDVKADTGVAAAELLEMYALVRKLDGKNVDIKVDVNEKGAIGKLAALKASLLGTAAGGQESSNAFRSFNAIILAAVTILPALVPILAAVGGGLLALGPLALGAGAGIGAMIIGFSGISTAVQAFSQQQKKSAADTQASAAAIRSALYSVRDAQRAVGDAERSAARAAVDSARAVAQARQSAAESIRSALEAQRQAQESYAESVRNVKDAEEALANARDAEKQKRQSTKNAIADNRLAIRQAVLTAFDATNTLNQVMADGSSTHYDKAQAKLAYDQAQQQLKELRQQRRELAKEKRKQDKDGVKGADSVKSAQQQLTDALRRQKDAQRALGEAAHNVDQARIKGAQAVQQALLQQSRSEADGARSIARAKEQLARAQLAYNEALKKQKIGSSADQNLRDALQNLGPAGRKFARFIADQQQGFYRLRGQIQAAMLPPVQHAIERIETKYGPQLARFFVRMGRAAGNFFTDVSKAFDSPAFQRFGKVFDKLGPKFFRLFGKTTIAWMQVFASLMATAAPFSLDLAKGLLGMSDALARFLESKKGREGVEHFMEYAFQVGPDVLDFLGNFIKAAVNLGIALAPWGGVVLKALDGFLKIIGNMNPKDLGLIATAIIGLFIAFQVGVGIAALALSGASLLASGIGVIIAAVIALVVIASALYIRFKFVRKIVDPVAKSFLGLFKVIKPIAKIIGYLVLGLALIVPAMILVNYYLIRSVLKFLDWIATITGVKAAFKLVFEFLQHYAPIAFGVVKTAVEILGHAIKSFWEDYAKPALTAFGDAVGWLWKHAVKPVLHLIGAAFHALGVVIKKVWNGFIWPILDLFIHIGVKLFQKVWLPLIRQFVDHFRHLGAGIHTAWKNVIHPALQAFGDAGDWLWRKVFKPILGFLGDRWKTFADNMKFVYDHTLKPLIDKFIDLMGGPQGLKSKFHAVVDSIKSIWDSLKKILAAPIVFVLDTVINHGLIAGFNKVAHFVGSKEMDELKLPKALTMANYATGGILPGYTPGRDVHRFLSPTGGQLNLSGGEAIMRPEFTRAMGPDAINALNAAAAQGGEKGVRRMLGFATGGIAHFAKGGVFKNPDARVSMDGHNIAAIAAAQILLAEKIARRNYSIIQGSMAWGGHAVGASGSSHNYPGVADIARSGGGVTFADQAIFRKVAFAAWARNIAGAASVGSGEHIHAVSLLSPGDQKSPQVYGSWPGHTDGLHGYADYGPRPSILPNLASLLSGFDLSNIDAGGKGHHGFGLPGWLIKVAKNPLGYFADKVTGPLHNMVDRFGDNDYTSMIAGAPAHLLQAVAHKAIGLIPGGTGIMKAAGNVIGAAESFGDAAGHAVGSVLGHIGLKDGGILPYNGTMKYDAGGYLPPGLTSVVNLTGKPEPVFTHDQFEGMGAGRGGLHYAPTFNGTDLTPEDVMDDLEFTYRKMSHASTGGRYAGPRG